MGVGSLRLKFLLRSRLTLSPCHSKFSLIFFFMIIQWLHHLWDCIYIPGRYISEVLSDPSGKEGLSRYI